MNSIRPVDLPEIRAELQTFAASPSGVEYWNEHAVLDCYQQLRVGAHELQAIVTEALAGDLYFVSTQMAELATAAGLSLPVFDMQPEDIPSPSGVLLFEQVPDLLSGPDLFDEARDTINIAGAAWTSDEAGCWITPIVEACVHSSLTLGGPVLFPFIAEALMPPFTRDKGLFDYLISTLRATWLLMQQPLAESSEVEPDRAARKRLRRAGYEPRPVRVIALRRPKHTSSDPGDTGREYQHQWIVRGHWRQQWHPKRQVHRPVWIAPHIKGPEGAPLIGGEKVYALKR